MTIIDQNYLKSINYIQILQERLNKYEWWIVNASVFGDNKQVFLFFVPLFVGFSNTLGVRALWAAVLSDWLNLILKWLFKGDRPYWWVEQNTSFLNSNKLNLRQFPNTCESGPGTPSGHLMINVALFYVAVKMFSNIYIWHSNHFRIMKLLYAIIAYSVYGFWIALIFISRMYILTHFFHQCLFGIVFGLMIGHISWSSNWLVRSHLLSSLVFAFGLIGSSLCVYFGLIHNGLDPLWAIPLALRFCARREFVHVDTQPYFIMVRFFAVAIGIGFSLARRDRKFARFSFNSCWLRIAVSVVGICAGQVLYHIQKLISQENLIFFLAGNFLLFLCYTYSILNGILRLFYSSFHFKPKYK